jgi:hypothetical protein
MGVGVMGVGGKGQRSRVIRVGVRVRVGVRKKGLKV